MDLALAAELNHYPGPLARGVAHRALADALGGEENPHAGTDKEIR